MASAACLTVARLMADVSLSTPSRASAALAAAESSTAGVGNAILRHDPSACEKILRERETEVVLILGAEAKIAEGRERILSERATRRILESGQPFGSRRRRIAQILIARRGRSRRLRG